MRIAVWHNLPSGGGKRALFHQISGLVDRGHSIEVWSPPFADHQYASLNALVPEHIMPFAWKARKHQTRIGSLLSPYRNIVDKLRSVEKHSKMCAGEIEQRGFDLLLAHPCQFFAVPFIGRYLEIPKVLYLQEPFRKLYEARPNLPWPAMQTPDFRWWRSRSHLRRVLRNHVSVYAFRIQAREELRSAQAFDKILVNSYFSRESVLRAYALESTVCSLGVDTEEFHPVSHSKAQYVVGLGSISERKGIDRAITALATVEKRKRLPLVWISNVAHPDYQEELQALALEQEVDLNFRILVSDEELVNLLSHATAMIYTSRLEPFGFAPLEANACGTAVIAVAEGGVRETVIDGVNGILVDAFDPRRLGKAVLKLSEQPSLAHELGLRARQHVLENWTWDQAVDCLEEQLLAEISQDARDNTGRQTFYSRSKSQGKT